MPTFRHGKSTGFQIEKRDGTMFDLSTYLREINFPRQIDTPESTTFQNTTKTYVQGIPDGRFSCSGFFDATADELLSNLSATDGPTTGDTVASSGGLSLGYGYTLKYAPEGVVAGRVLFYGRVFINNYSIQGGVSDLVAATLEFVFSGRAPSSNSADLALRRTTLATLTDNTVRGWGTAAAASFTYAA